jgi:murein DD-endopeptidase MepM/ murein hydrolase activator NlpD
MAHRDTLNKRVLETLREARASAAKLGKLANTHFSWRKNLDASITIYSPDMYWIADRSGRVSREFVAISSYEKSIFAAVTSGASRVGPIKNWQYPAIKDTKDAQGRIYSAGDYDPDAKLKLRYYEDGKPKPHKGIDIPAHIGAPIYAAASGIVVQSKSGTALGSEGYGKLVLIQHQDGKVSFYAHLSRKFVIIGQKVSIGQVIGHVGLTDNREGAGSHGHGSHLHFEVILPPLEEFRFCKRIDPRSWVEKGQ